MLQIGNASPALAQAEGVAQGGWWRGLAAMGQALGLDACTGRSLVDGDETDFDDFFDCEEEACLDPEPLLPAFEKELQPLVANLHPFMEKTWEATADKNAKLAFIRLANGDVRAAAKDLVDFAYLCYALPDNPGTRESLRISKAHLHTLRTTDKQGRQIIFIDDLQALVIDRLDQSPLDDILVGLSLEFRDMLLKDEAVQRKGIVLAMDWGGVGVEGLSRLKGALPSMGGGRENYQFAFDKGRLPVFIRASWVFNAKWYLRTFATDFQINIFILSF